MRRVHTVRIEPDPANGKIAVRYTVINPAADSVAPLQLLIDIQHPDGSWLKRECLDINCTGNSANTGSDDDSLNSSVEKGWVTGVCQIALDSENAIAMWSDENPLLYRAVVQLQADEQKLDQVEATVWHAFFCIQWKTTCPERNTSVFARVCGLLYLSTYGISRLGCTVLCETISHSQVIWLQPCSFTRVESTGTILGRRR